MPKDSRYDDLTAFLAARGDAMLRTAVLLAPGREAGEDLLQEALERLLRKWHTVDGDPESYLRRIMYNRAVDGWRARARRAEVLGHPVEAAVAVAESKRGAAAFWSALRLAPRGARVLLDGPVRPASGHFWRAAAAAAAGEAPAAGAGSAPSAEPGAGVLVADLDTGYDPGHPDLAGVVPASKNFTGSKHGIQDEDGHGTWTASIIAGSGAASNGKYQGVAPGARLLPLPRR